MGPVIVWGSLAEGGWVDVGTTEDFSLDLAYGIGESQENDFQLDLPDSVRLGPKSVVYLAGTGFGGVVDAVSFDSTSGTLSWSGRSWQGVLEHRVVRPPAGEDYLVASGSVAEAVEMLISASGDLVTSPMPIRVGACPEVKVSYQFPRYYTAWDCLVRVLGSVSLRPTFSVARAGGLSWLEVGAEPVHAVCGEVDSDLISFSGTRQFHTTEHLVAAGQGDLADRMVRDLYARHMGGGWVVDQAGTAAEHPLTEVVEFYDYSSAQDEDSLVSSGTERLLGYQTDGEFSVSLPEGTDLDVCDVVEAYEARLGLTIRATIEKVVCKAGPMGVRVSYEPGRAGYSQPHALTQ